MRKEAIRLAVREKPAGSVDPSALKGAKNDGQATGLAMKHLKQKGLAVLGEDVAAAVKQLRAG